MSSQKRLENLLEPVPDALVGMDQAGVTLFVNHQKESLFGNDRDDLVGQPIQTLAPEYLWEVYSEHQEYFADPRSWSMGLDLQLNGRQQDGTARPVNISLSHLDTGDVLLVITACSIASLERASDGQSASRRGQPGEPEADDADPAQCWAQRAERHRC